MVSTENPKEKETTPKEPSKEKSKQRTIKKELALSADRHRADFSENGGRQEMMLVNTGEKKVAVKIRSSNNKMYRVDPVYMFVDQGQAQLLVINRMPGGPAKDDKLVVEYVHVDAQTTAKECFPKGFKVEGQFKIVLHTYSRDEEAAMRVTTPGATGKDQSGKEESGKTPGTKLVMSREIC
ncbi:unnamed protein product, partial [Mesorhabditis spiculigera]